MKWLIFVGAFPFSLAQVESNNNKETLIYNLNRHVAMNNLGSRDPPSVIFPQRIKPANSSLPTASFYFPVPDVSNQSLALVSTMMMTLDELGPTLSDYVWVDLVVSVVTNRTDAIYKSDLSVVNNRVIGFTGSAQYSEIIDVAYRNNIPVCDGLDTEHKLSNHQDYPKFFRTIPSTKFQIQSMLRLMQSIGWTECSFITSSSFSDPQVFLTEAANFGLKIQESYFIDSISACSSIGDTILKSNAMVLVYLGLPGSFSVECFSMLTSKLPYKMGYSWIIDDGASQLLDQQSNSNFPGVFSATIQEGVGPGYDSLLTNWRNISYQNRYPGISFFKTPPRGFMFYRSCLELMLRGYLKKLEDGVVTPAQLSAGPSAAWTNSIKVPESFEFSKNPSATGNVSFIPLTGDRVGTFLIRYCNGSGFYSVGNMDSSAALIVNSTLLAGLGWVKPSFSQSPPVSTATIALSVAGAILFLIIIVFVFRNFRENERGSEKQQETESTTPVGLGISMSGTGQQALNILQRLKEQREHHQKPFLNQVEIDILTDALTSGGNSAYNPTFEITPKNGSAPVDQELQEFLMNTMLAQSKRNTEASYMPPPAPRESDHLKSPPPEMKRERSIFGNLLRTPSGRSLPRESEERDRERSTSPTGMPLNDPESQSSDKIAIRRDKSVFQSPTARPTISRRQRPLSGEVEQPPNLPSVPSGSAEHLSLSAPRPSKTGLVPDDKNQPPRTHTIKIPNGQPLPGGKSRAASIYSHATVKSSLTISRRISAFAQVFVPQSPVPASPSKEFQDASPSTSNLSLSLIPDLTRKFEDFDVLIRPAKDLTQISSAAVQEYLDAAYFTWSIDMFKVCKLSEGHPLYYTGAWLIEKTDLLPKFKIENEKFKHWLLLMEKEYRPLPYHNCIHASDVLQSFYFLAFHSQWGSKFTSIEKLAGIIAAVGHDIDHPGVSNQFLVKARDPIAIMYSDASVNEYHHSAHMFSVTLTSQYNIFSSFSTDEFEEVRRIIIKLILATDMGKHFEILSKFKTKIQSNGFRNLDTQENRLMVLEIALKCSDLNNPSKTQEIAVQWAYCIMEEFYRQGDKERELGLPISNFMDRNNSNVAKCQVGFIDLLVAPLYGTWALLGKDDGNNHIMKNNINTNKKMWQHIANIQADPNFAQMRSFAKSNSSIASSAVIQKPNPVTMPAVPALPEIFVMKASGKSLPDLNSSRLSTLQEPPMPAATNSPTTESSIQQTRSDPHE